MTEPVLSVVILTWNSRPLLEGCLAALPAATAPLASETIVVYNRSRDATGDLLTSRSDIVTIRNPRNRGVAPARNQGLRCARGDFVALLDVDTVPAPGAFATLIAHLREAPRVGLVGPKLVGPDGGLQYSCRRFPTVLDKLLRRLPERWGRAVADDVELRRWDHQSVRRVDYVIGACQCIRGAVLGSVGRLDERIFYGPEDVDFCLRLWRAGHRVLYNPAAVVVHHEQRSARRSVARYARHFGALWYFFRKHGYLFQRPAFAGSGRLAA